MSRASGWMKAWVLNATFAVACLAGTPSDQAVKKVAGLPAEKALALGERMYREGILPSGEPMQALVSGDVPVAGTAFTCVSCHVRSGVGSFEGGIVTLPTNGARLFQPRYWKFPNLSGDERKELRLQTPQARPAYTDETLAQVLRTGFDPTGRELHYVMPRYSLDDRDLAILIHYLRSLSAQPSPGVDATTIRFATVVTSEVSAEDQEAMLVPMNNYVARHNQYSEGFGNRMYLGVGGNEMSGAYRKLALSVWRLKGEPETWARQLDDYLAKEPVFALLGGISYREWKPIHAFCESHKLPCLLPITDLPVVSGTDWYTQYFSKGYYQEGQAAARYLRRVEKPIPAARMVQIIQDGPEGERLAAGFRETMQELGLGVVREIRLAKGDKPSVDSLRALLQPEKPLAVMLWADAGSFEALRGLAETPEHPEFVFMSARLLGPSVYAVPEQARACTWIAYPYRDPAEEPNVSKYAQTLMAGMARRDATTRITTRVFSMIQILRQGLMDMDRNFYRDNFLDRVGMQADQTLPDYLRLSFGPGQRYASKGCYIMQLGPGPNPQLIRKSEWVIH